MTSRIRRAAVKLLSVPPTLLRPLTCSVIAAAFLGAAAPDALASGSISGQVKDSGTSAGIAGAQVVFHDLNRDDILAVATAITDSNGNYTQTLSDGTYVVLTHAPGTYINQIWNGISCSSVCNIGQKGQNITTISIAGGNAVVGINFALVSGGGQIAGTVTSAATGLPIAGVSVLVLDSTGNVPFGVGVTDNAGHYVTAGGSVTGNVLVVTLNTLGYQDESYNNHKCPDLNCNAADPVAVTLGATTNGIDFALDLGGHISGKVTDANGNPLANVEVRIDDPTGSKVDTPVTDGAGNFTSTGLASGTYYAGTKNLLGLADIEWTNLTCPSNSCNPANGTPISVTTPNTTSGINFVLSGGATISGTVTAANGAAPVANAQVTIFDPTGQAVGGSSTNNAGTYTTGVLPTGTYFAAVAFNLPGSFEPQIYNNISCPTNCTFISGTPIPVTANTPVNNINFSLLATGNGSITGAVTDSSTGLGVTAQVVLVGMNGIQQIATVNSNAAASGAYTFSNVATGSYYVRTNSSSLINQVYPNIVCLSCNAMTNGGTLVTVTNGLTMAGINFALNEGGHISGTITNSAGGAVIANIGVQIFNAAGVGLGVVNTNASGVYTSSGLPAGTYYARTTNNLGFVNEQWNGLACPQNECLATAGTPIVVTGTATTSGINFSLTMGGKISGTLTDATTLTPITFMAVTLFSSAGVNLGNVNTDSTGTYTSQGLPAGTYYARTATGAIFLNNQTLGYIDQLWNGTGCVPACLSPTTGTPITVTSGATTSGINFTLTEAGSVSGIVVDAGALTTGLSSVGVQIYTAGGALAKTTSTNTVGGYTVVGLPAGTYYARTSSGSNLFYQDQLYREMACGAGCTVTAGTPVIVPPLGMANGIDFTLSSGAGSISGTVTDAVTAAVLPAIAVQIYAPDGTLVKSANSNVTGAFSFGGLTPGTYYARTAVISGSVYDDQVFNGIVCGTTCTATTGTAIVVAADATRSNVDFKMTVKMPPTMALDRNGLIFTAVDTGTSFSAVTGAQTVRMTQSGNPAISWTAQSNAPWLIVSSTGGTGSSTSGSGTATLTISTQFVAGLSATQAGAITITLTGSGNSVGPISVTLNAISAGAAPFGSFDTPTDGVTGVAGSIAVTGWALDQVAVTRVTICRDLVPGEKAPADPVDCAGNSKIYIGDALFVDGARTDVQTANPTMPLNSRAGWGYLMLTNFLPGLGNGTFALHAYAYNADNLKTELGSGKTITCDNAHATRPFGAIDTPAQGGVVSGVFANAGWVLTQSPKDVPADSSTISVAIDGVNIGHTGTRIARSDITGLFSGSYDTTHAAGGKIIDTTTFANGVHTIFWFVSDTGGQSDGIGSRFFTISNGSLFADPEPATLAASGRRSIVIEAPSMLDVPHAASARLASAGMLESEVDAAPTIPSAIEGRRGFDLEGPLQTYEWSSGRIDVQAEELDRVELHLSGSFGHHYTGYLHTPAGLRPLPVGSSLDAATGEFTWTPGVGFYGPYDLTFVDWSGDQAKSRQDVRITLNAKGSNRAGPQTIVDVPGAGSVFRTGESFYVGGWAADLDSTVGPGVDTVHVWAYPIDASGKRLDPIFIGPAIYGGARPDVAAVYGGRFANSGYGIIVNSLPPGTYDIAVFAFSTVVNNFTPAKVVRLTVR